MKLLVSAIVGLFIVSCASGPKPPTYKRDYAAVGAKDFKYEDKNISFAYVPVSFDSSVPITIQNKTDKAIKIIWDETTFINQTGQSEKILHEGVRLLEKGASMSPSVIPPKANLTDIITPVSKVIWGGSSWEYLKICGESVLIPFKGYEQRDEECVGKIFGLFVTYEIEGKKNSFSVKYKLNQRSPYHE